MNRCVPEKKERHRMAPRGNPAPDAAPTRNTGEQIECLSGNARVSARAARTTQTSLFARARAGDRSTHDALKRQIQVERSSVQLCRRRTVAKLCKSPVRCVPAICAGLVGSAPTAVANGTYAVPVESTMDPSALSYCVMGLGWERQAVVSGQGSGYSSATHPEGCVWRTRSVFSPRVAASTLSMRGTEPYVRQPEKGAPRVPYNMITRREILPAGSGPDQAACGPVQRPLP